MMGIQIEHYAKPFFVVNQRKQAYPFYLDWDHIKAHGPCRSQCKIIRVFSFFFSK